MKSTVFILPVLLLLSCGSSKNLYNEVELTQLSATGNNSGAVHSILIVGAGDVMARQFIEGTVSLLQDDLNSRGIANDYLFINNDETNEAVVKEKMNNIKSTDYKHLLFIAQDDSQCLEGRAPWLSMNLSMDLFTAGKANAAWEATMQLSGKVYKKTQLEKARRLMLLHLRANHFLQ